MFSKILLFLNAFLVINKHSHYNGVLNPSQFVSRLDNVMVSETGKISELMLGMDDFDETDDLFDIQTTMIKSALDQGIYVKIYPIIHEYPWKLKRNLRKHFNSEMLVNITIVEDFNVDTTWIRDYGPIFIQENSTLTVIDMDYFQRRPRDDLMNYHYALRTGEDLRHVHLASEGGNILANGNGICIVSDVIFNFNFVNEKTISEKQALMRKLLASMGCPYTIIMPALIGDATGHVDMYMSWANNITLLVGVYTRNQHLQNHILVSNAVKMLRKVGRGLFDVVEMPMPNCSKCTWSNHVHIGNDVIVPVYKEENSIVQDYVLMLISHYTKKRIIPVFADELVKWNGVFHCITKTKP